MGSSGEAVKFREAASGLLVSFVQEDVRLHIK
jgi:hypothetical protein